MKKILALLAFLTLAGTVSAAEVVQGKFKSYTFTAFLESDVAYIHWSDGARTTLPYTSNPTPSYRCPCTVYQNGPRQLVVEREFGTGRISKATYYLNQPGSGETGDRIVSGSYNGYTFTARIQPRHSAKIHWSDGEMRTLYYNPRPQFAPKCPCEVYEAGARRLVVHTDISGRYTNAEYLLMVP